MDREVTEGEVGRESVLRKSESFALALKRQSTRCGKRPLQRRESGGGKIRYGFFGEEPDDDQELEAHGEEAEDAAFGADSAAGQPLRSVKNGIGEVAFHKGAAVGDGEEIGFAPVEAGVKADGVPEIAGAIEREGKKDADESDAGRADGTFTGIAEVDGAKSQGKNEGGGPEADAVRESELRVPAEQELLEESYGRKEHKVKKSPAQNAFVGQGDTAERIAAESGNKSDEDRNLHQSEEDAQPEFSAKGFGDGKPVVTGGTALKSGHDQGATENDRKAEKILNQNCRWRRNTAGGSAELSCDEANQEERNANEEDIDEQAPAGTEPLVVKQHRIPAGRGGQNGRQWARKFL